MYRDQVLLFSTSLSRNSGPLTKGDYLVRTSENGQAELAFSVVDTALVTKESFDELLVWALDLDSGDPISDLSLTANGTGLTAARPRPTVRDSPRSPSPTFETARTQRNQGYLVETTGGERYAVAHSRWQYGAYVWDLGLPVEQYPNQYVGYMYTDRPIYRLGETVYVRGVMREDDDAVYSLPAGPQDLTLGLQPRRECHRFSARDTERLRHLRGLV